MPYDNSIPPQTDEEWAEALKIFGRDREGGYGEGSSFEPDGTWRLSTDDPTEFTLAHSLSRSHPLTEALSFTSDGIHIAPRGEASSFVDGTPVLEKSSPPQTTLIPKAVQDAYDREDGVSGADERDRMRRYYEENGWLPAPIPGKSLRNLRRKAVQHLGLAGGIDSHGGAELRKERFSIISAFGRMVKDMFKVESVVILILRVEDAIYIRAVPESEPQFVSLEMAGGAMFCAAADGKCFIVGDMGKDWRFAKNPQRVKLGGCFLAAAPLRLKKDNVVVDVGSLVLYDTQPRDELDWETDRQNALLSMAGLLVFQLSTLQTGYVEQQSSTMYETCISFLRRGISSGIKTSIAPLQPNKHVPGNPDEKRQSNSRKKIPKDTPKLSGCVPLLVSKKGPRELRDARSQRIEIERGILQDYCDTLRSMFEADAVAMVDLEDFQLFVRPSSATSEEAHIESVMTAFLMGEPSPPDIEPVTHSDDQKAGSPIIPSFTSPSTASFRFERTGAREDIAAFLKRHLQSRKFWWEHDSTDELACAIMSWMPEGCKTTLGTIDFTPNGKPKFATFVTWKRSAADLGETSALILPFVWVLAGCMGSIKAILSERAVADSRLLGSNVQAHELRTPMHQIQVITQLLRSTLHEMAVPATGGAGSNEQVKDLLPLLDAIDNSGQALQGIVDNILCFLELKSMDNSGEARLGISDNRSGAAQPLTRAVEDIVRGVYEEDARSRRATGQPTGMIETILSIGNLDQTIEDAAGSFRRIMTKLLGNAYKFIEHSGTVEITVDCDQAQMQGCLDVAASRFVNITIKDSGVGMSGDFVRNSLGEPWSKEDSFAPGSGLSLYVAYRLVDLLDGRMEISSVKGHGCTVELSLPLPTGRFGLDTAPLVHSCSVAGFEGSQSLDSLGRVIIKDLERKGVSLAQDAQVVLANGALECEIRGLEILKPGRKVIYFISGEHEPLHEIVEQQRNAGINVRRLMKPITPSLIAQALTVYSNPSQVGMEDSARCIRFEQNTWSTARVEAWRPKGSIEEAIASLSLGDMYSHRRQGSDGSLPRSQTSSATITDDGSSSRRLSVFTSDTDPNPILEKTSPIKVLVVEDNVVNRKILVKIVRSKGSAHEIHLPPLEVYEAEDGLVAVKCFDSFTAPCIVLLDINMPNLDGFQTSMKMRDIEKKSPSRGKSRIIAVTALSNVADRNRAFIESEMDGWYNKPCNRATVNKIVDEARRAIMEDKG